MERKPEGESARPDQPAGAGRSTPVMPSPGGAQAGRAIDTGGGAYVGGALTTGGDFVGRDKYSYGLTTEEVAALVVELKRVDQPLVWDGRYPYLGLQAFRESDAQFFFGRESLVADLLGRVEQANFIVIAGPSGSGKSSVARAGLFHALRSGRVDRSEAWLLGSLQPRDNPLEQLAQAVERMARTPGSGDYLRQHGLLEPPALRRQLETLLGDDPRQRAVLLVDQFEELFTQTRDEGVRTAFIDLLTAAAQTTGSRSVIILCLRSDFVSQCARYPELRALMSRQFQLVGAMDPADLAKAITLPALEVGAEIDPALVARIIADMKGEPGALPLMSFALRDLFEAEKTRAGQPVDLTLPEYVARGGIESALERHANHVFETFSEEQKVLARSIFSKLIEVGHGRVDTRRTAPLRELIPAGTGSEAVSAVIGALAREGVRLITTSGGEDGKMVSADAAASQATVTIAHEKLIDAWPWLRRLVDENRELIALQNEIGRDAQAWAEAEQDAGFLYRGGRLIQVEEKLDALQPNLDSLARAFVTASVAQRQREVAEKEAQRRRTITILSVAAAVAFTLAAVAFLFYGQANRNKAEAENNLGTATVALGQAERERQRADGNAATATRNLATAAAASTRAIAGESAAEAAQAAAVAEAGRAEAQARIALSRSLAAQALASVDVEPDLGFLLAVQALRVVPTDEAMRTLLTLRNRFPRLEAVFPGWCFAGLAEEGETVILYNEDEVRRWNATAGGLGEPQPNVAYDYADCLRGGSWLAEPEPTITAGGGRATTVLANLPDSYVVHSSFTAGDARFVAQLGTTGWSSTPITAIWNLVDEQSTDREVVGAEGAGPATLSADGVWLAAVQEGKVIVHNLVAGRTQTLSDESRGGVAFHPAKPVLAFAEPQGVVLWDLVAAGPVGPALTGAGAPATLIFSPDGSFLAALNHVWEVVIWDTASGESVPLQNGKVQITGLAFHPDEQRLFTASSTSQEIVGWYNRSGQEEGTKYAVGLGGRLWDVVISPDGRLLATSISRGEGMVVRNLLTNQRFTFPYHASALAFSRDNRFLAVGQDDGSIVLLDTRLMIAVPTPLRDEESRGIVRDLDFANGSQLLVSAADDSPLILWDLTQIDYSAETLAEQVCGIAGRNLTFAEWEAFMGSDAVYDLTCPHFPIHPSVANALARHWDPTNSLQEIDAYLQGMALERAEAATVVRAQLPAALVGYAAELVSQGRAADAEAVAAAAKQLEPEVEVAPVATAFVRRASQLVSRAESEAALALIERARVIDPDVGLEQFSALLAQQGFALLLAGEGKAGTELIAAADALDTTGPDAGVRAAAISLLSQHLLDEAELETVIALLEEREIATAEIDLSELAAALAYQSLLQDEAGERSTGEALLEKAEALGVPATAPAFVSHALELAAEGDVEAVLDLLEAAWARNPGVELAGAGAALWEREADSIAASKLAAIFLPGYADWDVAREYARVCWYGIVWDFAEEASFACEAAVDLAPAGYFFDDYYYIDGRGIARALTGDGDGAIEDFVAAMDVGADSTIRAEWIYALQADQMPFTEEWRQSLFDS